MSELFPPEFVIHNQAALEDLAWELEASAGQFSLMLARCNYAHLRSPLIEVLRQRCPLEIRVLMLSATETALYTRIQTELGQEKPGALMVVGLESVTHLEQLLSNANQVREEFRKHCPFPVVLWVTDDVQKVLVQVASDLESWTTKTHFTLPTDALHQGLQDASDRLFSALLNSPNHETFDTLHPQLELGLLQPGEVAAAVQELRSQGEDLAPSLQASLDLVEGLQATDPGEALACFERSLQFWQQSDGLASPPNDLTLREGLLLFYRGQAQYGIVQAIANTTRQASDWQPIEQSLRGAIARFEQANRSDLIVRVIPLLQRVLQKLNAWDELEHISQQGIDLHRRYGSPTRLSQDYGFLAKVALERQDWQAAKTAAQRALVEIANEPSDRLWLRGLYRLFLAQAERKLGNLDAAVAHLVEADAAGVSDRGYPKFAIPILEELRDLYYERQQYREAFQAKQERLSIEQQYGIRAFVGAGRLQPRRQKAVTEFQPSGEVMVAPEIAAAGRQQDLLRLLGWIGSTDHKLIVVHGGSGVGKSSLINAGLLPALKQRAIGVYENLPVVVRQYTTWAVTLEQALLDTFAEKTGRPPSSSAPPSPQTIFDQLRYNEQRNLRTVLIFDQFEEFFFTKPDPSDRLLFFQFLAQCLQTSANISRVKVVLSLREDYLHYLLELNRLPAMTQTGIDALSRNVLYELGNFAPQDAYTIIQNLTDRAQFYLEPALTHQLVEDLAQEIGAVRPIELQVVGAQLQAEGITTLTQYRNSGTKTDLVNRYLAEVVNDCGSENQQLANLILYLLTDERGTRPLKTRAELDRDLDTLKIDPVAVAPDLDLILHIFVASGLALLVPETPADRYQLVHDYIAAFIRQQQAPQLEKLLADLETERQLRQQVEQALVELEKEKKSDEAELEELRVQKDQAKQELEILNKTAKQKILISIVSIVASVIVAVVVGLVSISNINNAQTEIHYAQRQQELARTATTLERAGVSAMQRFEFQQTEALLAATRAGQQLKTLTQNYNIQTLETYPALSPLLALQTSLDAQRETRLEGYQGNDYEMAFSPDGQQVVALDESGTVRLWNLQGEAIAPLKKYRGEVSHVVFTPDGQQLVTRGKDGMVRVWTVTGQPIATLKRYRGEVWEMLLSPDGQQLATLDGSNTARVWNLQGEEIATLEGHQGKVRQIDFSPDGQHLATLDERNTARVWNLQGQLIITLKGHQGSVWGVTFSPDGQQLATYGIDGTARLWNLQGETIATLLGQEIEAKFKPLLMNSLLSEGGGDRWAFKNVMFSPDGQQIVTHDVGDSVRLWTAQGEAIATLDKAWGRIDQVMFSPNGQRLLTRSEDGTVLIWTNQGKEDAFLKGYQDQVVFSPDGQWLATSDLDGTVRVWTVRGQLAATLKGHQGAIRKVMFSPDGQRLVTSGSDGTVRVWMLHKQPIATLKGHQGSVLGVSFSPDEQLLATSATDGTARVWDLHGQPIATLAGHQGPVIRMEFSSDGQRLATLGEHDTARIWTVRGQLIAKLKGHHQRWVRNIAFSPDGQRLLTGGEDRTAQLWTVQGKPIATLRGHQGWVNLVAFSPDGQWLVTSDFPDGITRLWTAEGRRIAKLKGYRGLGDQVAFSPDGQWLVASSTDGKVRLWASQGKLAVTLKDRRSAVMHGVISPDGQKLAATVNGTAQVWTVQGKLITKLTGHQGMIDRVVFSPDGQRLATHSTDGTAQVWTVEGQPLATLEGHQGRIEIIAFSPDGQRLATSGTDGTTRLWNVQGQQIAQYEGRLGTFNSDWSQVAIIQPSDRLLNDFEGEVVTLWQVNDLDGLLVRACDRLRWYLTYSRTVSDSDRAMCGIQPRAAEEQENYQSFNPLQWLQQWWMGATTPASKT